ncbi:MAG: DUF5009 domain-containing protein [Planctomycetaceae bacterium]
MAPAKKTAAAAPAPVPAPVSAATPTRLGSLDAYRGMVMIALAARGFGIHAASKNFPDSQLWQTLGYQFEHVSWGGCAFWDLIQPSFMFMVGVSLPFSYAGRSIQGLSQRQLTVHAMIRSFVLIFLGVFLASQSGLVPHYEFFNVLAQIGWGYTFLFLLWNRPIWLQATAAFTILVAYWAWFAWYPLPPADFDYTKVGVKPEYVQNMLTGFPAHWQYYTNPAARFDQWFLNLFPREKPFEFNGGGYTTLNFVPSLANMIFGLMTGEAIRRTQSKGKLVGGLLICAAVGLASGWALNYFGLCPMVKRIWTPGWALFSTGWCWLFLAGFYTIIDWLGFRVWAFPLIVAGMNSIVLYLMGELLRGWTDGLLQRFLGPFTRYFWHCELFDLFGTAYAPLVRNNLILLVFWLFVYWLYRQRIFVRI